MLTPINLSIKSPHLAMKKDDDAFATPAFSFLQILEHHLPQKTLASDQVSKTLLTPIETKSAFASLKNTNLFPKDNLFSVLESSRNFNEKVQLKGQVKSISDLDFVADKDKILTKFSAFSPLANKNYVNRFPYSLQSDSPNSLLNPKNLAAAVQVKNLSEIRLPFTQLLANQQPFNLPFLGLPSQKISLHARTLKNNSFDGLRHQIVAAKKELALSTQFDSVLDSKETTDYLAQSRFNGTLEPFLKKNTLFNTDWNKSQFHINSDFLNNSPLLSQQKDSLFLSSTHSAPSLTAKVGSALWTQQLIQNINSLAVFPNHFQQVALQLQPRSLGPLTIAITRQRNNQISVDLAANHASTQQALHFALTDLRESLAKQGLHLAQCNIHHEFNSEKGLEFTRQNPQEFSNFSQNQQYHSEQKSQDFVSNSFENFHEFSQENESIQPFNQNSVTNSVYHNTSINLFI